MSFHGARELIRGTTRLERGTGHMFTMLTEEGNVGRVFYVSWL